MTMWILIVQIARLSFNIPRLATLEWRACSYLRNHLSRSARNACARTVDLRAFTSERIYFTEPFSLS